jgi:hypothetical protein
MPKNVFFLVLLALVCAMSPGVLPQAAAAPATQELSSQSRPRITIHPRQIRPGPNAKRYCRAWLAKEYRVSGPVIVPQQYCWWR